MSRATAGPDGYGIVGADAGATHPSELALLRARMKRQALPWALQWLDRTASLRETRVATLMRALATIEDMTGTRTPPSVLLVVPDTGRPGT